MNLTEIAIKRPSLVIVIFLVLILGGLFAYTTLKYELLPDFSQPAMIITTPYPGASPTEVEQDLSLRIEEAISSTENLKTLKTQSFEGTSVILAEFEVGTDMKAAEQEVQRSIENIRFRLPEDVKNSSVKRITPSDAPVIQLVVASSGLSPAKFADLVDQEIKPRMEQIKGVARVNTIGLRERELQVNIDKDKLAAYGFSPTEVLERIRANNVELPAGRIKNDERQSTVRVVGKIKSIEDIKNIQLNPPSMGNRAPSSPISIKNVAEVVDALQEEKAIVRLDRKPGVALIVTRQAGANAVDISAGVRAVADTIQKQYKNAGVEFNIADDTSVFTIESANAVIEDLMLAVVIVAFIILMFLHSLQDSIMVLVAIPASLISTFIAMFALGYSINLMTLLAMSLVIGILVDDSIVVLENIHRHLAMKKNKVQAAIDGRLEIGFSAMAITLVDVVVFAPITLVNSVIGDLLRQYSVVVVVSTLMSLFVSFTLTPWMASRFGKLTPLDPKRIRHKPYILFERLLERLTQWYAKRLTWSLNHKWITLFSILGAFVLTGYIMSLGILGQETVAAGDKGQFRLNLEYDKNISLYKNNLQTQAIENELLSDSLVKSVFSNIGGASTAGGLATFAQTSSQNKAEVLTTLSDKNTRKQSTEAIMREKTELLKKKFHNIKIESVMVGFAGDKPIEVVLQSVNQDSLRRAAHLIKHIFDTTDGLINSEISVEEASPEVVVQIDRKKMNDLGLDARTVGSAVNVAINGNTDIKFTENNKDYDVNVRYDIEDRKSDLDLRAIFIKNQLGELIALNSFATFAKNTAPNVLERYNRISSISVRSDVLGITSGSAAKEIEVAIKNMGLPQGVSMQWGGEIRNQSESFGALGQALIASFILIYLIMVALYDSFIYPFVVLFSIPVSLIGAFIALNLAASNFSIFTMLGIIMLMGLVAKNGILIVDYTNRLKEQSHSTREAIIKACEVRLRPIMMTTLAMSLGMLPIALSKGASSEWKNGLGIVMIGGLLSSLMLTVFLVPVIYEGIDRLRKRLSRKKKNIEHVEAAPH